MSSITDINTVNVQTAFKYLPVKVNSAGGKSVGIQNKALSKKVVIRTPLMLSWGVSDYEGNEKFQFSLQFPGNDFLTPKTKKQSKRSKATLHHPKLLNLHLIIPARKISLILSVKSKWKMKMKIVTILMAKMMKNIKKQKHKGRSCLRECKWT